MNVVGHCPRCGSPIWSPTEWASDGVAMYPPTYRSCDCFALPLVTYVPVQPAYQHARPHLHALGQPCLTGCPPPERSTVWVSEGNNTYTSTDNITLNWTT